MFGIRWVSGSWSSPTPSLRAGDVEVAQAHSADPVGHAEVADQVVGGELRRAVGVLRPRRRALGNRNLVGLTVDRAGGAEHEPRHLVSDHRLEQVQGAGDVRAVVALGVLDRLADQRERGEVQHSVETGCQRLLDLVGIAQVPDDQLRLRRNGLAMAAFEVVQHDNLVAIRDQHTRDDRADVAGAAGDKELHCAREVRTHLESIAP